MSFLEGNEMKPTVSTLNVENILEEIEQSNISLSDVNDVNMRVFKMKWLQDQIKHLMITPLYMMWILHLQSVYYLD